MARKTITDIAAWPALTLEGNLLSPAMLAEIDRREAPEQTEPDYGVRKGLTLRDEIAASFRVGQAHYDSFAKIAAPTAAATTRFVRDFLRETLGFDDLVDAIGPVALVAGGGRVPVVVVPPTDELDRRSPHLSADQSRSAAYALQDRLNRDDEAMWGLAGNGATLRLMRDNASLTRPTFVEANLAQIFATEDMASFVLLWLVFHRSRFGRAGMPAADCALERWRDAGARAGEAARNRLAGQVEQALKVLGSGFLDANKDLRDRLAVGEIALTDWFNELLRLVYRLIFLMVAEDRGLLHAPGADADARRLYADGYSLANLRTRSARRAAWDRQTDRYEGLKIVFRALTRGEAKLGLPALGGLFGPSELLTLGGARISNRAFLEAIYRLGWLADGAGMVPVNWRAMETEELGSVYESLLELQPQLADEGRTLRFATDLAEQKGNQRKTTGSYYTPDSLVQALLDTALDPVLNRAESGGDDPAEALLSLSVIDPACGSGHFLLAAARRIAARVARIRAGGTPSATDFRHALRDAARRCIHGTDRNPMAVELTKVALWIETVNPGLPLGFFDAQIRCGDALLGVFDLKVLDTGVPDAAYKPLFGDDKAVARHYAQKNKRERAELEKLRGGFDFGNRENLAKAFADLRAMPEGTLDEISVKAERLKALTATGAAAWTLARACDFYCAAFLLPKTLDKQFAGPDGQPRRGAETVPTTGTIGEMLRGTKVFEPLTGAAIGATGRARALHWPLEFPDVMARGGFDAVLGNPPWERIKLQEEEFFALLDQDIATAKNAAARKRLIASLEKTNPKLLNEWNEALRTASVESHFIRESGRFPLGGVGDVNTYAVFADLCRQLLNGHGYSGLILPTGFVAGFTYRDFLSELLTSKSLVAFFGFENEDLIFPHITNKVKFGLLTISGNMIKTSQPWFTANIRQPTDIKDNQRRYSLKIDDIRAINPNTLNLPGFRWSKDAEVTAEIHKASPILIAKSEGATIQNDWNVRFNTMFHMANDSGSFIDHLDIAESVLKRDGSLATLRDGRKMYPLYEGKMIWHFDHRYGTYEGQTEQQANKGVLPRVTDEQHANANFQIQPRYWVDSELTNQFLGEDVGRDWLFAWRDVGPAERTFVGAIIPKTALGHTSPALISDTPPEASLSLATILSSLVVDYAVRQKSNRMTFFVIEQLPMLSPATVGRHYEWLGTTASNWLNRRAIELVYTNWEMLGLAKSLGKTISPYRWDPKRRELIQAEIDAAVMHLYGLSRAHCEWILDSFTVLRKYEENDFGEFRTKKLVLGIFDAIENAKLQNVSYSTLLVPAPGDPSQCHETSRGKNN